LIVSGFFTSPRDHERIVSGEATVMETASNCGCSRPMTWRASSVLILCKGSELCAGVGLTG